MSKKKEKPVVLKNHEQLVTAVSFSPSDGNVLASASADATIKIWSLDNNLVTTTLECEKRVATCCFSKDGSFLISGDWSYLTTLWDIAKNKTVACLQGHSGKVTCTSFRQDGTVFLTGSEDMTARIWDPRWAKATEFEAPDEVLDCTFSPDGEKIVVACKNNDLLMWDVRQPKTTLLEFQGHSNWATCCDYSPDGKSILSGSADNSLKLWSAEKGTLTRTFEGHTESVNGCSFCGEWIVSCAGNRFWGSKDNRALMWEAQTGSIKRQFNAHTDAVMGLSSHRPTARFATASMDKTIRLWDAVVPSKEKKQRDDAAGGAKKYECKLGCGKLMIRRLLEEHESKDCPNRPRECVYCKVSMPDKDVRAHEDNCDLRTYVCECDMEVQVKDEKRHEEEECGHRKVKCGLGCGMEVKFVVLEKHEHTLCQERTVTCKQGCGMKIVAKDTLEHMEQDCRCREVSCSACGLRFMAKDEKTHKRKLCGMRTMECALGCGETVVAKNAGLHEASCPLRSVPCALGCGASLLAKNLHEHETAECPKLFLCPHGCGLKLIKAKLNDHSSSCNLRPRSSQRASRQNIMPEPVDISSEIESESDSPIISSGSQSNLFPDIGGSPRPSPLPEPAHRNCVACGVPERTCSNRTCAREFCPRCLIRLGLPKSTPPLCAPCTRGAAGKYREMSRMPQAPSPFRFS